MAQEDDQNRLEGQGPEVVVVVSVTDTSHRVDKTWGGTEGEGPKLVTSMCYMLHSPVTQSLLSSFYRKDTKKLRNSVTNPTHLWDFRVSLFLLISSKGEEYLAICEDKDFTFGDLGEKSHPSCL